ncbi:hypothetical protein JZX76_00805 [Haloarcula hispanica]|uniref:Uncharacterized protein n=1 Tax=Haloarcula hispanica TaxID=51589 RepID=A0A482TGT7_HALHI|nr:hypothetical protein [Haloarcula hispanica]MCJ0618120.1 hypothetical protein [Haloarcula hispanica]RYJ15636.1 hypothetical protein ELS20_00835 [Haloarcula hispanica]
MDEPVNVRYQDDYAPNGTVAPFVEFEADANFSQAEISIEYNESRVSGAESNVSIYWFNESANRYEQVPSSVNTTSNTVTASTTHFSTYTVFDNDAWTEYLNGRNDIISESPDRSKVGKIESWTFEDMPASLAQSNWTCDVEPRGGRYKDEPADGTCEIEEDRDAIRVGERTNRERTLSRSITLPDHPQVYVIANTTAHIQSSWSHAAATLALTDEDGKTDIYRLETDDSSDPRTENAVRRVNISEHAGEEVTVTLRADARHTSGDYSWIRAHNMRFVSPSNETVRTDSDGDGISDFREVTGIPLANGPTVTLDPNDADTDGDGIPDGEEVDMSETIEHEPPNEKSLVTGYRWTSNPAKGNADTDGDGLVDSLEKGGWTVQTVNKSGDVYRYDYACETDDGCEAESDSVRVTSDPTSRDSDGDGLSDTEEKRLTHTDPDDDQTYEITAEQSVRFEKTFDSPLSQQERLQTYEMGLDTNRMYGVDDLSNPEFTDASGSFDFVRVENQSGIEQFEFTALDGNTRSDYWLSNRKEIRTANPDHRQPDVDRAARYQTDPWDPDTDDDGLTDGQEINGVQTGTFGETYETSPTTPDTDGDGYWDGWIGVYDVGHTDNVVLYREHLRDDDDTSKNADGKTIKGIGKDEMVSEQAGVHAVETDVPAYIGTTEYDETNTRYHSNIHIGELLADNRDPTEPEEVPIQSLDFEVDFYDDPDVKALNTNTWETRLEMNLALYGIDADIQRDEVMPQDQVENTRKGYRFGDVDTSDGFGAAEIRGLHRRYQDKDSSIHLIVVGEHHSETTNGLTPAVGDWIALYNPTRDQSTRCGKNIAAKRFVAQQVALHEFGHVLDVGELEKGEGLTTEVYSGDIDGDNGKIDHTPERIQLSETTDCSASQGTENIRGWSVMNDSFTIRNYHYIKPYNAKNIPYSIEELLSAELDGN